MKRKCVGFGSNQLRQVMRALSQIKYAPDCSTEQANKIDAINLHILTELDIRGDTFVWTREEPGA